MKVQAVNALSASHVDMDLEKILQACQNDSVSSASQAGNTASITNVQR